MKNKTKILEKHWVDINYHISPSALWVENAMEEYAEQKAIEFVAWKESQSECDLKYCKINEEGYKSYSELYKDFLLAVSILTKSSKTE